MDHGIEWLHRIRLVGNVFGCTDVGQIACDDVLGAWHMLECVPSTFSVARMEDHLVTVLG